MFLGLDIGTSAVKALLVDEEQRPVARGVKEYPTLRPGPGLSEQDPRTWIDAVEDAVSQLRANAPQALAEVKAIGLSGQMHSLVALGADGAPLRPAILWNDARGVAECAELREAVPRIAEVTGVRPMPGFTAAKILWLRKHEPELFDQIASVVLPKDYVRKWLTGELVTDMSDAAGMQLLDEAGRCWAPEVVAAVGLVPEQLPRLIEGTEVSGSLAAHVARRLGLRPGIPVAGGGGDAGTGALGISCVDTGQGFVSLGTAATFVVAQDSFAPRPELLLHNFAHSIPGRWYQMAAMLNGASCLAWALSVVGESDVEKALGDVAARYNHPSPVTFLPYLAGERTPHDNPDARGVLFGLSASTDRLDIVQAVLEGVAFSFRDAKDCLEAAGCFCPRPGFIGGGAKSALWGQIVASVLGLPVTTYHGGDLGPAFGAARLAIIAAIGASVASVCSPPEQDRVFEPDAALAAAYAERHRKFSALYQSLREQF